jgi:hypothetical protein
MTGSFSHPIYTTSKDIIGLFQRVWVNEWMPAQILSSLSVAQHPSREKRLHFEDSQVSDFRGEVIYIVWPVAW